ncbi:FG-GAP-like repeat-containing protein [Streptomyces sp. NBC_01336]|uniref:FG-GAP-like repeat-containing protein n=1 Tax=Streptomyces sp. NBC_01336 TaxID=2903829 RepID=UPI002E153093|nr:FG-GAP-like repeat-containing protein [Streptomyces sp. NBC_01336]
MPVDQTFGSDCNSSSAAAPHCQKRYGGVNSATGAFGFSQTDAELPGDSPLELTRSYSSDNTHAGSMGPGWSVPWETRLSFSGSGDATFKAEDGSNYLFKKEEGGGFASPSTAHAGLAVTDSGFHLETPEGKILSFDKNGLLIKKEDKQGRSSTYSYGANGKVSSISSGLSRTVQFKYTENGLLGEAILSDGRRLGYSYSDGRLSSYTKLDGKTVSYEYDPQGRIEAIKDPIGNPAVENTYDNQGRVENQLNASGDKTAFSYLPGETDVTAPDGGVWTDLYDENVLLAELDPFGNKTSYSYNYNLDLVGTTDAQGNKEDYAVDQSGRVTERNGPLTGEEWVYSFTDGSLFYYENRNGHGSTYKYDSKKQLTSATDPKGNITRYTYTATSQLETVEDPLGKIIRFGYDSEGNQNSVTDPSGSRYTQTFDAAGRTTTAIDSRGNLDGADPTDFTTTYTYDNAGRVLTEKGARGIIKTNTYDETGNLKTVTDANSKVTRYTYDTANRLTETLDPAGNTSKVAYDVMGNVASRTDATGAKTTYTYDEAGRMTAMTTPRGNVTGADPTKYTWTYGYDKVGNQTTVTDPAGKTTRTDYDAENRPVKVTDPLGFATETTYDGEGNVLTTTDALGKVTTNTYDDNGRLTSVKDRTGKTVSYGYDANGNLTSETSPLGFKTTYAYDDNGRQTDRVDPRGNVAGADPAQYTWHTGYDAAGNTTSQSDPLGNTVTALYDPLNQMVERTDPRGKKTSYEYDTLGRLKKLTAPDNGATSMEYDALGNMTKRTDANQHATSYTYDDAGRVASTTDPLTRTQSYKYDPEGNLTHLTNARGQTITSTYDAQSQITKRAFSDGTPAVSYTYDDAGRPTQVTDAAGTRTYAYDKTGRLKAVTPTTGGGAFAYTYDDEGRITGRSTPTQEQALDWAGATQSLTGDLNGDGVTDVVRTDSKNGIRTYLGSADGTFTTGVAITGTGSGFTQALLIEYTGDGKLDLLAIDKTTGHLLRYNGDGKGGFAAASDRGAGWAAMSLTAADFNKDGKPDFLAINTSENKMYLYPGTGTGTFSTRTLVGGGWGTFRIITLDYNNDTKPDLLAINPADGHLYFYPGTGTGVFNAPTDLGAGWNPMYLTPGDFNGDGKQDFLGRSTTAKLTYFYPGTGAGAFGTRITQADSWETYGQPLAGKFDSGTTLDAAATDTAGHLLTWHGDNKGNLKTRTTASRITSTNATYSYDDDGRRTSETANGTTITYGYDPAGNLTTTTLPLANGHTESRGYDKAGQLTAVNSAKAGTPLTTWQQTLNPAGQPSRIDSTTQGQAASSRYFTYDNTGQLLTECVSATKADTCPKTTPDTAYTYDKAGNRATSTTAGITTAYTYDDANQLSSTTAGTTIRSFSYDADGNQTSNGTDTLAYDAGNQLTTAKTGADTVNFTYDADGNRTAATKNGVRQRTSYWDINNPLVTIAAETNGIGQLQSSYTYDPQGQVESLKTSAGPFYYHHDGLGSVTALTNTAGTNQYTYSYNAFGKPTTAKLATTAPANPFTYTGQYEEPATTSAGYYLRARNYDPELGRFTSQDPATRDANQPALNDYAYADNQPTSRTDPSGRCYLCVSAGIGAVVGAVVEGGIYSYQHRNGGFSWSDFGKATGEGAVTGAIAGLLMPGSGQAVARGLGLSGWRGLATSAAVNAGVGAGFSWAVNEAHCRPTDPWDLLFGAAGGASSSLVGPAFNWMKAKLPWRSSSPSTFAADPTSRPGSGVSSGQAAQLRGDAYEVYLMNKLKGIPSETGAPGFKPKGAKRQFDGKYMDPQDGGEVWYEAKSGDYWTNSYSRPAEQVRFRSKLGEARAEARKNGASFIVISENPIPSEVIAFLAKKSIPWKVIP